MIKNDEITVTIRCKGHTTIVTHDDNDVTEYDSVDIVLSGSDYKLHTIGNHKFPFPKRIKHWFSQQLSIQRIEVDANTTESITDICDNVKNWLSKNVVNNPVAEERITKKDSEGTYFSHVKTIHLLADLPDAIKLNVLALLHDAKAYEHFIEQNNYTIIKDKAAINRVILTLSANMAAISPENLRLS